MSRLGLPPLFPRSPGRRRIRAGLLGTLLSGSLLAPHAASAPTFEKDVRPILKAHCFDCHGEGDQRKGGLDVRLRHLLLKGGDDGPVIVPGKPDQSELLRRVQSGDMPKRDKKLSAPEIATLRSWIASGARTSRPEPAEPPSGVTEEDRTFWSFQPIGNPQVPSVGSAGRVRTPVDAFLSRDLARRGLQFSPDADRITLLRRVTFDLTGLPPTPADEALYLADASDQSYEHLVDRLLESRHYGERWARHWLDVAGYADSDGYSDADPPRPFAYKYRDYVIRALNADKPFDRFLAEQIAGDEIARAHAGNAATVALSGSDARDLLTATGFLRMGVDGSATDALSDRDAVRNQVVADTLKIVSTSLLGLSVGCAQCHDHRYDPIPQSDYYRLRAVFEPAYNWKQWRTPQERLVSLYTDEDRRKSADIEREAAELAKERETKQTQYLAEALTKHLEKFDAPVRDAIRSALDTPAAQRTDEQKKLLADNPSVNIHPGVLYQYNPKAAEELKAMDARITAIRGRKPPEDFLTVLTEPTNAPPITHVLHRGDYRQPRDAVPPGGLSVLGNHGHPDEFPSKDADFETSGRRLALARWLTSPTNPLVARVLVNRVWMHYFGRGLVGTPSDFGAMGERPTHPELLDWLARHFQEDGWSLKRLHRLILTSTAYRQSSATSAKGVTLDPGNQLYWRKPVQRLDAEAIRDAMLSVSGSLNRRMYGPPVPVRPDVHGQIVVGEDKTEGDNKMPVDVPLQGEEFRRSIYIQVRRSRPLAMLHAFDAPVMEVNCERRQSSTVATQSLMLMNSAFVLDQSVRFAGRIESEAGPDPARQVVLAWQLAYSRPPRPEEAREALAFLADQSAGFPPISAARGGDSPKAKGATPESEALASLCQVLLSSNEFLYLD
ncbi:MAG: PSD1 domain-containing protein [Verrucomicrobiales bacterium]|nr:PSD1 domain-containing protein [Verrucomicrobiales bacterium]